MPYYDILIHLNQVGLSAEIEAERIAGAKLSQLDSCFIE
jgi:hypothetical protein